MDEFKKLLILKSEIVEVYVWKQKETEGYGVKKTKNIYKMLV